MGLTNAHSKGPNGGRLEALRRGDTSSGFNTILAAVRVVFRRVLSRDTVFGAWRVRRRRVALGGTLRNLALTIFGFLPERGRTKLALKA